MISKNIIRFEAATPDDIDKLAYELGKMTPGNDIFVTNKPADIWYCEKKK